jgi:glycosyltransferase involved in cell wall biosynthesis
MDRSRARVGVFCSTIIPTIGRPTLARAVESVLGQRCRAEAFEVIVVNDSGRPLAEAEWQRSERVRVIHTNRHNRSVARNAGAAIAQGRYLHFLDDDDWLLPDAFEHLRALARARPAGWLHGGFRLVDNTGQLVAEVCPDEEGNCFVQLLASEWLPLQAAWIEARAFFAVGGFASLVSLLGGYEDIDLSRQIARCFDFARTAHVVASIRMGDDGSTTDYRNMFRQDRQSRDKLFSAPGSFARLRASANGSAPRCGYWHGRIVYYYLGALRWNLQHRRLFAAASRGACALAGLAGAGRHVLSSDFWGAFRRPHFNRVRLAVEATRANLFTHTVWN